MTVNFLTHDSGQVLIRTEPEPIRSGPTGEKIIVGDVSAFLFMTDRNGNHVGLYLRKSEARAIASALMGAAAEL